MSQGANIKINITKKSNRKRVRSESVDRAATLFGYVSGWVVLVSDSWLRGAVEVTGLFFMEASGARSQESCVRKSAFVDTLFSRFFESIF